MLRKFCVENNIHAIIVIGGDDSMTNMTDMAEELYDLGITVVGVPKTIDGDLRYFDEEKQEFMLDISFGFATAAAEYAHIVGNLLSLAKPAESNPQQIDIHQEIERCVNFIEAKAKSQKVMLKMDFEDDLPTLRFDPAELRQLLLNVMMNGLQAMPEGGTLWIKTSYIATGTYEAMSDGRIRIRIEDEGAGISSDLQKRVFEPFFTTKTGGTGLGLAICNSIVKRYNGEIGIEQSDKGGTQVRISLPCS